MVRNDEHTLNTTLAACLRKRSPLWREPDALVSEKLSVLATSGRPDILVAGSDAAPVVVETEYDPARTVEEDARGRLSVRTSGGHRIEQAIAVKAPRELRDAPEGELEAWVEEASFACAVWSEPVEIEDESSRPAAFRRFPDTGWLTVGVDQLATLIEVLGVSERAVAQSTDILEKALTQTSLWLTKELRQKPDVLPRIGEVLFQDSGMQTARMALAIIANACTFQSTVAGNHGIKDLSESRSPGGFLFKEQVLRQWMDILNINYYPIFHTAREILRRLPSREASEVLGRMSAVADQLVSQGANRSHDLTGRMFQRMIQDRKFLATYYTRPEAAVLLSELAVGMADVDWESPEGMTRIRVADLACGTGTLMSSAYHSLIRRYRRAGWDDRAAHSSMMEESLIAADIMPAATHLTGAMLSSVHPASKYERTQVYTLPYGDHPAIERPALGALSLLDQGELLTLFGTGLAAGMERLGGRVGERVTEAESARSSFALANRSLDLAIMNPPFTRPTNHEIADAGVPSFAGFGNTEAEQAEMSQELKRLRNFLVNSAEPKNGPPASDGNAGLASNFLDLAHQKLRFGGVLAMVMPGSLALGGAWTAGRNLLARHYDELMVISLAATRSEAKSFSADTGMAEVLILGKKRAEAAPSRLPSDAKTIWITLVRRPRTGAEAIELARAIRDRLREGSAGFELRVGAQAMGRGVVGSLADGGLVGVRDGSLAESVLRLTVGELRSPRTASVTHVPVTRLGDLGNRGPLHRDVGGRIGATIPARGPFEVSPIRGVPDFPILWSHDADRERRLVVAPDSMGDPRPGREQDAAKVWATASQLHFTLDFRLNSQSLAACLTPSPAIGGTAWPSFHPEEPSWERAMAAWANTTPGLILFWWAGTTQQSGRSRLTVSRLPDLRVLDLRALSANQVAGCRDAFEAMKEMEFLPAHRAHEDPARWELDRRVLGDALGFDEAAMEQVAVLREKWCAEPSVHGGKRS